MYFFSQGYVESVAQLTRVWNRAKMWRTISADILSCAHAHPQKHWNRTKILWHCMNKRSFFTWPLVSVRDLPGFHWFQEFFTEKPCFAASWHSIKNPYYKKQGRDSKGTTWSMNWMYPENRWNCCYRSGRAWEMCRWIQSFSVSCDLWSVQRSCLVSGTHVNLQIGASALWYMFWPHMDASERSII